MDFLVFKMDLIMWSLLCNCLLPFSLRPELGAGGVGVYLILIGKYLVFIFRWNLVYSSWSRSFFINVALTVRISRRFAPVASSIVTKSVPKHPWASRFCSVSLNLSGVCSHYETEQRDSAVKWKRVFGDDNDLKQSCNYCPTQGGPLSGRVKMTGYCSEEKSKDKKLRKFLWEKNGTVFTCLVCIIKF